MVDEVFFPLKVDKSYEHIRLQERIVEARLNDQQGISHTVVLNADDPRSLGKNIAPIDTRSKAELQQEKISRFFDQNDIIRIAISVFFL